MTKQSQIDQKYLANLRECFPLGSTVYTVLRHVSRSGMQRTIGVVALHLTKDDAGKPAVYIRHPNYSVSQVLGLRCADRGDGVKIGGCGQDMGFEIVYALGRALFPDGFGDEGDGGIGKDGKPWRPRPASKAEAKLMVDSGVKFSGRNGDRSGWDDNGGYALDHRWL